MVFIPFRIVGACRPARRGWAARGAPGVRLAAIAAACVLASAGAGAEVSGTGAIAAIPVSLQPASPAVGDSEIKTRLDSAAELVVAGEPLHRGLLRQFYGAHGFQPVWSVRPSQADALVNAVLRAGDHGLDPELFHGALLRGAAALSPNDRDLLLSDAFLTYADALARGALPLEQRMDDEDLTPEPVSVAAALDNAIGSADPATAIGALAPNSPDYVALRQALQSYRAAAQDGIATAIDAASDNPRNRQRAAANRSGDNGNEARLRQIEVNLERLRWMPRHLPADRVWVNLPNAQLVLYRNDQPVFSTRVVIGQLDWQTPELQTDITSLLFNPPWNVPPSIASLEILPKLSQSPDYMARHHMVFRHNGAIQQLPGAGTALGQLKFEMPNRFDVYLHDTPLKALFSRDNRRQSHGCVRVQNPRELAALLLQQPVEVIDKGIALGTTNRRMLPEPIPVFLVYLTAFPGPNGTIEFRPDIYQRNDEIWQHLHPARQAPVAQGEAVGQRKS